VSEEFINGGTWANITQNDINRNYSDKVISDIQTSLKLPRPNWNNLTNEDCIETYSPTILTSAGTLVAVSKDQSSNNSVYAYGWGDSLVIEYEQRISSSSGEPQFEKRISTFTGDSEQQMVICFDSNVDVGSDRWACDTSKLRKNASEWTIGGHTIAYCISGQVDESRSLQFSVAITWMVVFCNLLKTLSVLYMLLKLEHDPLVTIGDAIASFSEHPDTSTKGNCLLQKSDVQKGSWIPYSRKPMQWTKTRPAFWFQAGSCRRWMILIFL
jgi:hypothetical protein